MADTKQPFAVALAATRAGNLFTAHPPGTAGFDLFSPVLLVCHLGRSAQEDLGLPLNELLARGRRKPHDATESFTMTYLATRGGGAVNGVSRLHGRVNRRIFAPLFPRWPASEVPVAHVTNGGHVPNWDTAAAGRIWTDACGKGRWLGRPPRWRRTCGR